MTDWNLKDFLSHGAFLQIGPDLFKLLIGPFKRHPLSVLKSSDSTTWLYMPQFWDFLDDNASNLESSVYQPLTEQTLTREEFISFLATQTADNPQIAWKNVNESQFQAQFEWSQQCFLEGRLEKTVPIIRQQGHTHFVAQNLLWCLQHLIPQRMFGWSYGFFENGQGFIGHTPEILAQWSDRDRQLKTVALAGTYPKTPQAYEEILHDRKVMHEHQIVVQDIERQLQGLSFHPQIQMGETDVLELKYLLHLMTDFELEVAERQQVLDVIQALHPTAAMAVFPRSQQAFRDFQNFTLQKERGSFAAPFAILEPHQICCVVSIRNMMFNPEKVEIFSGCGVTADSQYAAEVQELQGKRDSVKKMLGLLV